MNNRRVPGLAFKIASVFILTSLMLAGTGTAARAIPPPDLALTWRSHWPVSPYSNDDLRVDLDVTNLSSTSSGAFHVRLYIDYIPTTCAEAGIAEVLSAGVPGNTTYSYHMGALAGALSNGSHFLSIFVDSNCEVTESDEVNNSMTPESVTITAAGAAPANDDFNSPTVITGVNFSGAMDASGATRAADDPHLWLCGRYAGMKSVWYQFTPSRNMSVILDTFGSNYDTMIAVWTGSRGSLTGGECSDDSYYAANASNSRLHVNLSSGTTYHIELSQYTNAFSLSGITAAPERDNAAAGRKSTEGRGPPMPRNQLFLNLRPASSPITDFDSDLRSDAIKLEAEAAWWRFTASSLWGGEYMGPGTYVRRSDFDSDRITDPAKVDASNSLWYRSSYTGQWVGEYLGPGTWSMVDGSDFEGDGRTDPAHFDALVNALWYRESRDGAWHGIYMGPGTYTPVAASDFDGDGKTDPAHFNYSSNVLWYRGSGDEAWHGEYLGPGNYAYVPACDFDGDGKTDPAHFSSVTNTLWYKPSDGGAWVGTWMGPDDLIYVPAVDFDGDGKTDPAVFMTGSNSIWYAGSASGSGQIIYMGPGSYTIVN